MEKEPKDQSWAVSCTAVGLPISKQKLNQLGERLAASDPPHDQDLDLLNDIIRAYQAILGQVEEQLSDLGLAATSRVKTRDVLIDKLRRQQNMALARVQDLAGARTVCQGGRVEQDRITQLVVDHFHDRTGKPPKVVDRRTDPSFGYRAVHVIVFVDGVPVEVQIRTELQNKWAQLIESLADKWGRGIRYGEPPENPERIVFRRRGKRPITRRRVLDGLIRMSDTIANLEFIHMRLSPIDERLEKYPSGEFPEPPLTVLTDQIPDFDKSSELHRDRLYRLLRRRFKRLISVMYTERRKAGRIVRRTVPLSHRPSLDEIHKKLQVCDSHLHERERKLLTELKDDHERFGVMLERMEQAVETGRIG